MSIRRAQDERIEGTPDGISAISEIMDVPDAPTIGTATDLGTGSSVSVTFTAAVTGGTPSSYTVTSTPGSITGTGSSSPVTVSGLTSGTSYTFKVKGQNAAGVFGPESSASGSVTPAFPVVGSYDALASVTLSTTASSVIFSGIPSGYKDLQLRIFAQTNRATYGTDNVSLQINSDTGANYIYHYLRGSGSAATSAASTTSETSIIELLSQGAGTTTSGVFGTGIVDIIDYSASTKYKTVRSLNGCDLNGSYSASYGYVSLVTGLWRNTDSVISLTLAPVSGSAFTQYSSFALYGVK